MDPVYELCKSKSVNVKLCFLCQKRKNSQKIRIATQDGIENLRISSKRRCELGAESEVTQRVKELDRYTDSKLLWHKQCYSAFTDKGKIGRLEKKFINENKQDRGDMSTDAATSQRLVRSTRRLTKPMNWERCIFCQDVGGVLNNIMTLNLSSRILEVCNLEKEMSIRLAGVTDLIAAEGKYHLSCLSQFNRLITRTKKEQTQSDLAFVWLCNELRKGAVKGHVYRLDDVWQRYTLLCSQLKINIPDSFASRRATFKSKLDSCLDEFHFYQPLHLFRDSRQMILIPIRHNVTCTQVSVDSIESDLENDIPNQTQGEGMNALVHAALKLKSDLNDHPGHDTLSVSASASKACIPESLHMFLNILYGKSDTKDPTTTPSISNEDNILGVAQDIVYGVSQGKKWTPKHIGLTSTLHQTTRSKRLVNLFHKAGHCLSYCDVNKIDTSLAENTLSDMDVNTGAIYPATLSPNNFAHFSADNIDILDETLDGKNTFHATQMAVYQKNRNSVLTQDLKITELSKKSSLQLSPNIFSIIPSPVKQRSNPIWPENINESIFIKPNSTPIDYTFLIDRQNKDDKSSWTTYYKSVQADTSVQDDLTTVVQLPMILSPAHEFDTLNTVVRRCMAISEQLHQDYTVITVDQALYYKLMQLKWKVPEYTEKLIPRLGGLHISMNFLKVIGKHMKASGLVDLWVNAGVLAEGTAETVMSGKSYKKAMRVHKLTYQAIWRILMPKILDGIDKDDSDFQSKAENIIANFTNSNFKFWSQYLELIRILLMFTKAQREGNWLLYKDSFSRMLPFFFYYDHQNYSRWGVVNMLQMERLPDSVNKEFEKGNFVVKWSKGLFNQVDPDHAQEWINGIGKRSGGIVGITKSTPALRRWSLSFNARSKLAAQTYETFGVKTSCDLNIEASPSRRVRDKLDENSIMMQFVTLGLFSVDVPEQLMNIFTKDFATKQIQESLLNAHQIGKDLLQTFLSERLISDTKSFYDPLVKQNPTTFDNLYQVNKSKASGSNAISTLKADRSILLRLITAYEAGRKIDLFKVLSHELLPVPISIAEMDETIRGGNKANLLKKLQCNVNSVNGIDLAETSCLIIDAPALIMVMGKPIQCKTFTDLADSFVKFVVNLGEPYTSIHVVFDRYRAMSIKSTTRNRRSKRYAPIRRDISTGDVPLPHNWNNFLSCEENKTSLAELFSHALLNSSISKEIVISGGFDDQLITQSTTSGSIEHLRSDHEEADTRLVLHAANVNAQTVVIYSKDTDVIVMLIAHLRQMSCNLVYVQTSIKDTLFIPIHEIRNQMSTEISNALIPFHALTGCDSTSYFYGISKSTAWDVLKTHGHLLAGLGEEHLEESSIRNVETFVCMLYSNQNFQNINEVRVKLFFKKMKPETLPPTRGALEHHIKRSHYQSLIWKRALLPKQNLPSPVDFGWKVVNEKLQPILISSDPLPRNVIEIISCNCILKCDSNRCSCVKACLVCTALCHQKNELCVNKL